MATACARTVKRLGAGAGSARAEGRPPSARPRPRWRPSLARGCVFVVAAISAAAVGCAWWGRPRPNPPLALARSSDEVIGHANDVELKLVNRGAEALRVPWPPEPFLLIRARTDTGRAEISCKPPPPIPTRITWVALAPGGELPVRIDLTRLCAVSPRQRFGAEAWYSVPEEVRRRPGGRDAWTGTTAEAPIAVAPSAEAAAVPGPLAPLGPQPARPTPPDDPPAR